MKKKISFMMGLILVSTMVFSGCGNSSTQSKTSKEAKLMFSGSSTMAPIISKIADNFTNENKKWNKVNSELSSGDIQIAVSSGGSGTGVKAALEKTSNFGLVSREVSKEEKAKMPEYTEYKIGMDALTISVNAQNSILKIKKGLTKAEIQKIFSGEAQFWNDIEPSLPHNKIVVVVRDAGGGAGEVFEKSVMGDKKIAKDAIQSPSMGALGQKVMDNKDAIGYASVGIVDLNKDKIVAMNVDGIEPTADNILSGKYIIARPLLIIKNGELSGEEKAFISYINSEKGLNVVKELGFVPLKSSK